MDGKDPACVINGITSMIKSCELLEMEEEGREGQTFQK